MIRDFTVHSIRSEVPDRWGTGSDEKRVPALFARPRREPNKRLRNALRKERPDRSPPRGWLPLHAGGPVAAFTDDSLAVRARPGPRSRAAKCFLTQETLALWRPGCATQHLRGRCRVFARLPEGTEGGGSALRGKLLPDRKQERTAAFLSSSRIPPPCWFPRGSKGSRTEGQGARCLLQGVRDEPPA